MKILIAAAALAATTLASAQPAPGPKLGKVLQERSVGKGKRELVPLPRAAWSFDKGEFRSASLGLALRLPQVGTEKVVSVREGDLAKDPEGHLLVGQLVFVPDAAGANVGRYGPVSAVLVNRLPPEASREREAVFKALEPRSEQERKKLQARGIEFRRVGSPMGEALLHVVPNRFFDRDFPSKLHVDQHSDRIESMGVIRYVMARDEALLTLAQVIPCKALAPDACRAEAERASERFAQGLVSYGIPKKAPPAAAASSAPARGK